MLRSLYICYKDITEEEFEDAEKYIDVKSFIPKRKNIGTEKKNINNPDNYIHDNNYSQPYYASNTYKALQYHQPGFYPNNY